MLITLSLLCVFADDATFNGLKTNEWIAMAKDDPLPRKRKAAVIALGQLVTPKNRDIVLPTVAKVMRSDSQAAVRLQAVLVLAQQPAETLAGYITDLTEGLRQEKDSGVKREQAIALGRLGKAAQAAVLPLIDALKDSASVKAAAAETLGRIGPGANGAANALITLTRDDDRSVRQAAAFALGRIDPADPDAAAAALVALLSNVNLKHRNHVLAGALVGGSMGLGRDAEIVATTVVSLGLLGVKSKESVRALAQQMNDPDPEVRQSTALALAKMTVAARAAEPELKAALSTDSDTLVRVYSAQTLAAAYGTDTEPLIALFAEQLKVEPDFQVRLAMVDELGALGPTATAALPILRQAQRDTQVKVREAAARAIRKITKPVPAPEKP